MLVSAFITDQGVGEIKVSSCWCLEWCLYWRRSAVDDRSYRSLIVASVKTNTRSQCHSPSCSGCGRSCVLVL